MPFEMSDSIRDAMQVALFGAQRSPDTSTQNGAVLVGSAGVYVVDCNRFPQYVDHRLERPEKYAFIEHAERNVIFRSARAGITTKGTVMVCPWAACDACARAIVQAGVVTLVRFPMIFADTNERWVQSCLDGDTILREGGVSVVEDKFDGLHIPDILRDGKVWVP